MTSGIVVARRRRDGNGNDDGDGSRRRRRLTYNGSGGHDISALYQAYIHIFLIRSNSEIICNLTCQETLPSSSLPQRVHTK